MFLKRQVLVKLAPGENMVPSGIVTSVINPAWSQPGMRVGVQVGVCVGEGVNVVVGVTV